MSSKTSEIYDPMAHDTMLHATALEVLDTPRLRVTFDDGVVRDVDFTDIIATSRWFTTLAVPTTFETVEIINDGRGLQWITGADFCVDALRMLADEQAQAVRA